MMDVSGRVLAITQALGDPLRLAVLQHLMGGPASVSELMTVVGAEQSRLSNHLAVLRERGLVRASRHGRQVLYELHDRAVARLIESLAQIGGPPPPARAAGGERSESPWVAGPWAAEARIASGRAGGPPTFGKPPLVRVGKQLPGSLDVERLLLQGLPVPFGSRRTEEVATIDVD